MTKQEEIARTYLTKKGVILDNKYITIQIRQETIFFMLDNNWIGVALDVGFKIVKNAYINIPNGDTSINQVNAWNNEVLKRRLREFIAD